jgi:hypothetical protein
MDEYKATEQELQNALLSVRQTDWEYLSERLDSFADVMYGRGADSFSCFMDFKASDNYSEMLEAELGTVQEWKELCLEDMIIELNRASMECRKRFNRLVKRYFTGLKKMLLDIVYDKIKHGKHLDGVDGEKEREYWQERYSFLKGVDEFKPGDKSERGDIAKRDSLFLANENGATCYPFTENDLIQKILVFQELLKRISGKPAKQPADARCKEFIRNVHESTTGDDLRFYGKMKSGRTPIVAKGDNLEAYIKKLHGQFNKENPTAHVAHTVFESAFKSYKANLPIK